MALRPITDCDVCGPVPTGERVYSGTTITKGVEHGYDLCEHHYING